RAGRYERDLLAFGVDHQHAGPLQAAQREVDVALDVDAHAVDARLGAKVEQFLALAGDDAVGHREGVDLHGAGLGGGLGRVDLVGAVVVVGDVQGLFVGAEGQAVGLLRVVRQLGHPAVLVDAIDGAVFQFALLVAEVARVAEVNAALLVDDEVVGRVEALPHVFFGDDAALLVLDVPADDGAAALV